MLTADGRPQCDTCGAVRPKRMAMLEPGEYDGTSLPWLSRPWTPDEYALSARSAGWAIGEVRCRHDARCDRCSRPDPVTVAHCRDIERTLHDAAARP
jgi:hypothetical protein